MKRFRGLKGTIIFVLLIFMLIGYYFYLSNRHKDAAEESAESSQVQDVLLRDLSRNYPATPKEVLRYYSDLTECFYNGERSEEELTALADKAMELYDEELIRNQTTEYKEKLKEDIDKFHTMKIEISSYKTSSSTDVDYFTKDGRECAGLYCVYTLRSGSNLQYVEEVFILRKDESGHWKILGWDRADNAGAPSGKEAGNV